MADSSLTRKATHRSSSQKKVEIGKLSEGDASCLLLFVIITLIQRTVRRLTAGYARTSYQSLRMRRGLCVTIGLILAMVREHLSKLLTQKPEVIEGPIKAHD
jgi:hypothetical protein